MLPDVKLPLPASLASLLAVFGPLFTAPSFRTFCSLACGFFAHTGKRTVCGMLAGAGLARSWSHDRAHFFFARGRWNPDDLGLAIARLVVALLVPAGEPVTVAIDDTLFRRRGKKIWAASWFRDGSAPGSGSRGHRSPRLPQIPYVSLSAYTALATLITRRAVPRESMSSAQTYGGTFR